jgi:hypothetical protein
MHLSYKSQDLTKLEKLPTMTSIKLHCNVLLPKGMPVAKWPNWSQTSDLNQTLQKNKSLFFNKKTLSLTLKP